MNNTHTHHITPLWIYLAVASALMVLTIITVAVSNIDLGGFNVLVALGIASIKALLVAFFFMQLWWDKKIYLTIFSTAMLFLTIFLVLTMFDTQTRGYINPEMDGRIKPNAPMYDTMESTSTTH
jgi:cytochrome c oxidase subunit IV